jgi:Alpha/beta hydrolase domain
VTWETAGTSHSDYWIYLNYKGVRARDATPPADNPPCPLQIPRSRILNYRTQDAAYDHMVQWMLKRHPAAIGNATGAFRDNPQRRS